MWLTAGIPEAPQPGPGKEGQTGRHKLNQFTQMGAVGLTIIQGYFIARNAVAQNFAIIDGPLFYVGCIIALVGGTMFLLWLGEQITSRGIGNGVSLIIMAGIVAQMPSLIGSMGAQYSAGTIGSFTIIMLILMLVALVLMICFMERAQRRVLIQYPKRASQKGMMQADRSHLPLKLNTAGVIPPIFASSLLLLPLTITQFSGAAVSTETTAGSVVQTIIQYLQHGQPLYMLLYAAGIIFFCFFYTALVFNSQETADNLKRNGGFTPGIRPGKNTSTYPDYVLTRITVMGAF